MSVKRREQLQTYINTTENCPSIQPTLDCKTRWNSTTDMIDNAIKLRIPLMLLVAADRKAMSMFELSDHEWDLLSEFLNLFSVSILYVFMVIAYLFCSVKDFSNNNVVFVCIKISNDQCRHPCL